MSLEINGFSAACFSPRGTFPFDFPKISEFFRGHPQQRKTPSRIGQGSFLQRIVRKA